MKNGGNEMNLSKIGKRIIAVTMTAAVVVSGIVFSPNKTIKAADTEPQVRVLGATLRTEGNKTGTQSLRVGIEVINASYASECGIKVKVKGSEKETVVSTANEKYQKLYSKDVEADKIVYSVVIENIPVEKASSEIEFIGFVNNIETPTEIFAQTDTVSKSVNGVVQSMSNSLGKDVILLDSGDYAGTLVYEYAKLDMSAAHSNLEMPDKEGNYSSGKFVVGKDEARAQCEYVDSGDGAPYYKVITPKAVEFVEGGEDTRNTQGKGIGYIHPSMVKTDSYIYSADIKADAGVPINLMSFWGWNTWLQSGHEEKAVDCNGKWTKVEFKTANQDDGSNYFSTANAGAKEYCIKNVVIYKVIDADYFDFVPAPSVYNLPLNEKTIKDGWNAGVEYKDGTATVKYNAQWQSVAFYLPDLDKMKKSKYKYIAVTYTSDGELAHEFRRTDGQLHETNYGADIPASTKERTIVFGAESKDYYVNGIGLWSPQGGTKTITIKSIVFYENYKLEPETEEYIDVPLDSCMVTDGGITKTENEDGSMSFDFGTTTYKEVSFALPKPMNLSEYKYLVVDATLDSESKDLNCKIVKATDGSDIALCWRMGVPLKYNMSQNDDYSCTGRVAIFSGDSSNPGKITIKSIRFYKNDPDATSVPI